MKLFLVFILLVLFCSPVFAGEKLGTLKVEDILVRPQLLVKEPQTGEFSLGNSSVALSWTKSHKLGAIVRIGSQTLLNPMAHFTDEVSEEIGFIEAFGQVSGEYGRVRFGLIPIEFGVEGSMSEAELVFPRGLLYRNRVLSLRDYGLSYQVGHLGYYTKFSVHNGESAANKDGRMFVTSSWGWSNYRNVNAGISAQTGTTKPESTGTSSEILADFDVNEEAKWRLADLYLHWHPNNWNFVAEAVVGEVEQGKDEPVKFVGGLVELGYESNPHFSFHLKYDHFDPNENVEDDLQRIASFAFAFTDKHKNNALYIIGSKIFEEGQDVNNDEARIVWRLSPQLL